MPLDTQGYGAKCRSMEAAVKARVPAGAVAFSSEATPGATGAFEVSVNGQLVHSKMERGQGFVDMPAKLDALCTAITAALGGETA